MSELERLIQEHCPHGVIFDNLVNVADVLYGYPCDASKFNDNQQGMPLIRIRNVLDGTSDTYTTEEISEEFIIHKGVLPIIEKSFLFFIIQLLFSIVNKNYFLSVDENYFHYFMSCNFT